MVSKSQYKKTKITSLIIVRIIVIASFINKVIDVYKGHRIV